MDNQIILSPIPQSDLVTAITKSITESLAPLLTGIQINQQKASEGYLTRKEAAAVLRVTLPTLHEYTKAGKVPAYRVGRRVRYIEAEVREALQKIQTV